MFTTRIARLVLAVLAVSLLVEARAHSSAPRTTVIAHVSVIDTVHGAVLTDRDVIITGDHIIAVAAHGSSPADASIVDGAGRFVIPGLWDMHVHTGAREVYLPLYLANGLTGVRDMGGDGGDRGAPAGNLSTRYVLLRLWADEIRAGSLRGPQMVLAGFMLDGASPMWPGAVAVRDATEAAQAARTLQRMGVDFLKIYERLSREEYFSIARTARSLGIAFAGHVPSSVTAAEASLAGQKSIEHLSAVLRGCSTEEPALQVMEASPEVHEARGRLAYVQRQLDTYDDRRAQQLFATFRKQGTWQVPTLVELRAAAATSVSREAEEHLVYVPQMVQAQWRMAPALPQEWVPALKLLYQKRLSLIGPMHAAGVRFLAGSDSGNPYTVPGFALHEELELLVAAGLSNLEALRSATLGPAMYFGEERRSGSIEAGKRADLVLLDANPLQSIANTRRIHAVMVNGLLFDRPQLDEMLQEVQKRAARMCGEPACASDAAR